MCHLLAKKITKRSLVAAGINLMIQLNLGYAERRTEVANIVLQVPATSKDGIAHTIMAPALKVLILKCSKDLQLNLSKSNNPS
jgi:hypothetical protein